MDDYDDQEKIKGICTSIPQEILVPFLEALHSAPEQPVEYVGRIRIGWDFKATNPRFFGVLRPAEDRSTDPKEE